MICITGVPGAGKSTVAGLLEEMGYGICDGTRLAADSGCLTGDEVDVDCLRDKGDFSICDAVQAHFSHLLKCTSTIILEANEAALESRMVERGYSASKIRENIDVQLSGGIYYEALQYLPASRIFVLDTTDATASEISKKIAEIIETDRKR